MPAYGSISEARQAFDHYARIEPRLTPLWELCTRAAPPEPEPEHVHDAYGEDPFESDDVSANTPSDGWCAEDFFLHHVKSRLLLLVGYQRPGPTHELHSAKAFEEIYDLLLNWALHRPCACCAVTANGTQRGHDSTHAQP